MKQLARSGAAIVRGKWRCQKCAVKNALSEMGCQKWRCQKWHCQFFLRRDQLSSGRLVAFPIALANLPSPDDPSHNLSSHPILSMHAYTVEGLLGLLGLDLLGSIRALLSEVSVTLRSCILCC